MHPILARGDRLASYLAGWITAAVLVAAALTSLGLGWLEALGLLVPVFVVYAFVCLSAWYVCRSLPLRTTSVLRVLASCGFTSLVAGALWLAIVRGWMEVLGGLAAFAPAAERYERQLPLLYAIGVLLFVLAVAVHYAVLGYETVLEAERERLQLEVLTREAELRALRAQINPHFLYNSLNSISALTSTDPAGARRMCLLLSDFLRQTLSVTGQNGIRLADEIALTDRFLDIEQIRFRSRLQVKRQIDDAAADCRVPPLILQPLIENAVAHGIAGLIEGGTIHLEIARRNGSLSIAIENPRDADTPARTGKRGVGLDNVRRRLAATFGAAAELRTHEGPDSFRVELDMPWSVHE